MNELVFNIFMAIMAVIVAVSILLMAYAGGLESKDKEVCNKVGGYYAANTCFRKEAVIDYEGGKHE